MSRITVNNRTIRYTPYVSERLAVAAAAASVAQWIILGDDGRFWLVRPVDAGRLMKAGYELRTR